MDTAPWIGAISGILICLLGLLITLIMRLTTKVDHIWDRISQMVTIENYAADRKEIALKLDEHGERLLVLEIRVKEK